MIQMWFSQFGTIPAFDGWTDGHTTTVEFGRFG